MEILWSELSDFCPLCCRKNMGHLKKIKLQKSLPSLSYKLICIYFKHFSTQSTAFYTFFFRETLVSDVDIFPHFSVTHCFLGKANRQRGHCPQGDSSQRHIHAFQVYPGSFLSAHCLQSYCRYTWDPLTVYWTWFLISVCCLIDMEVRKSCIWVQNDSWKLTERKVGAPG